MCNPRGLDLDLLNMLYENNMTHLFEFQIFNSSRSCFNCVFFAKNVLFPLPYNFSTAMNKQNNKTFQKNDDQFFVCRGEGFAEETNSLSKPQSAEKWRRVEH